MESELFAFLHIPKTGGSYFINNIVASFPKEPIQMLKTDHIYGRGVEGKARLDAYIDTIPVEKRKKVRFIFGHELYDGIHARFNPVARYITLLRDPVLRTISLYNFRRMCWERFSKITYFLSPEDEQTLKQLKNSFLVNGEAPEFPDWLEKRYLFSNTMTAKMQMGGYLGKDLGPEAMEAALKRFYFVGIIENADEDLLYLYHLLGVTKFEEEKNASTKYVTLESLDDRMVEKIKEKNSFDLVLYELGKKENKAFKDQCRDFDSIIDEMKKKRSAISIAERSSNDLVKRAKKFLLPARVPVVNFLKLLKLKRDKFYCV